MSRFADVAPGCRRIIRRGRLLADWEPVNIASVDTDAIISDTGERIPFAEIVDLMVEWRPPHPGAVQCRMPYDDEATRFFSQGAWSIDDGWIECGHWFTDDAELAAHQAEHHAVFIDEVERQVASSRLNPGPVADVDIIETRGRGGPPRPRPAPEPPTEKQVAYLAVLAERKGVEVPEPASKQEASREIERLKALPDQSAARRNKYDAPCSECGVVVPAGEGVLRFDERAERWLVGHVTCPDEPQLPPKIPDGFYAVDSDEGHVSFYRVSNGYKPGVVFVDLLVGGGANGSLRRESVPWRNRDAVLAKISETGVEAAALRFRRETGRCVRCGRGLSNKTSRDQMLGPECRRKV